MGLSAERQYQNYHRVLNRAKWSGLQVSRIGLRLLVAAFVKPDEPVVLGVDETLERRRGKQIKARGIFRDAVRSSKTYTVYSAGLRLGEFYTQWARCVAGACPLEPAGVGLARVDGIGPQPKNEPRQRSAPQNQYRLDRTDDRGAAPLVAATQAGAVRLGLRCAAFANPVTYISRLRLDTALYTAPGPQAPSKRGPKPKKGRRLPSLKQVLSNPLTRWTTCEIQWYGGKKRRTIEMVSARALWYTPGHDPLPLRWVLVRDPKAAFAPTAFFVTDPTANPVQILTWFVKRWSLEVTFQEARTHLGFETQRQWSPLAIARTTPALLGLFSLLVTLLAHHLTAHQPFPTRSAAWYRKPEPTFADAIALVRRHLWSSMKFTNSPAQTAPIPIPANVLHGLVDTLCYPT